MARGVNKVILLGNLGKDPDIRFNASGAPVASFSLATTQSWRDKQTGQQQDRTEWHNLVCFSRLAEIVRDYVKRGSKIYVEGMLRTTSWEQDGQKRYRTEVIVNELQMLDAKGSSPGGQGGDEYGSQDYGLHGDGAGSRQQAPEKFPEPVLESVEDDIPF